MQREIKDTKLWARVPQSFRDKMQTIANEEEEGEVSRLVRKVLVAYVAKREQTTSGDQIAPIEKAA